MTQTVYVLISCMMGQEQEVLKQVESIPQVQTAIITYGEYDVVAKIQADSIPQLAEIVSSQIRQIQRSVAL